MRAYARTSVFRRPNRSAGFKTTRFRVASPRRAGCRPAGTGAWGRGGGCGRLPLPARLLGARRPRGSFWSGLVVLGARPPPRGSSPPSPRGLVLLLGAPPPLGARPLPGGSPRPAAAVSSGSSPRGSRSTAACSCGRRCCPSTRPAGCGSGWRSGGPSPPAGSAGRTGRRRSARPAGRRRRRPAAAAGAAGRPGRPRRRATR